MARYFGITIGPIMDTISLTSKPAGLWCGSYLFSYLVRKLCEALIRKGIRQENFLSPFVGALSGPAPVMRQVPGVGLFHDRIIFRAACWSMEDIKSITDQVKRDISISLADAAARSMEEGFIYTYLQIHVVEKEVGTGENPVSVLSRYLDASELMYTFNQNYISNPIVDLFDKDREDGGSAAELLKESFLVRDCGGEWPLLKKPENSIMSMEDIAAVCIEKKYLKQSRYCAVIKADGDYMSRILEELMRDKDGKCLPEDKRDEMIRGFSQTCLEKYEVEAAKKLKEYGAVNIYAGGDDLMFIAPLTGVNGESLFELLKSVRQIFTESYKSYREDVYKMCGKYVELPTLSFGVVIHYYKFPLYEWVKEAAEILDSGAKRVKDKDFLALKWTKHSGKTRILALEQINSSPVYEEFLNFLNAVQNGETENEKKERFLNSVPQKFHQFHELLRYALECGEDAVENFMHNTFDSEIHGRSEFQLYLERILKMMLVVRKYVLELSDEKAESIAETIYKERITDKYEMTIYAVVNMITTAKFLIEGKGD